MRTWFVMVAVSAALLRPVRAQEPMSMPGDAGDMAAAMRTMDRDMAAAPMTGDPDRDFVAMMIPHHQGAVDMAKAYLRDGRDPAMLTLARSIVADQEREIAFMRAWQEAR